MKIRVVDFFCGAGGFSEGFRQQGFNVIMGIDNWRPAVETHNLNHHLNDQPIDILDFEFDWVSIDKIIPDAEVIIGSPPCVDFSMSNRAGKAHKGLGIRLIETYLRIIVVKKLKPNSTLKVWLMENVPNSRNFVQETYSLKDLNLVEWAFSVDLDIDPDEAVISVKNNGDIFNAADYGSPQGRKRFICGELTNTGEFPTPVKTHNKDGEDGLKRYVWLSDIKTAMPSPTDKNQETLWEDPNYRSLKIKASALTNHFYDTGVYEAEWEKSRFMKRNHPYMGRMQFPEGEERTSRTVMATRSASTRESILYKSEYDRKGDGEYRLPTIREIASLMGFPYTYQFTGSEGTKWRQIGNAVCPHMAATLAKAIREEAFGLVSIEENDVDFSGLLDNFEAVENLNDYSEAKFDKRPTKKKGSKFRRHPFKIGNMTVALLNHHPARKSNAKTNGERWYPALYEGSGKTYFAHLIDEEIFAIVNDLLFQTLVGNEFQSDFEERILAKIPNAIKLQQLFEKNEHQDPEYLNPISIVNELRELIKDYDSDEEFLKRIRLNGIKKDVFPKRQLMAMWGVKRITDILNS